MNAKILGVGLLVFMVLFVAACAPSPKTGSSEVATIAVVKATEMTAEATKAAKSGQLKITATAAARSAGTPTPNLTILTTDQLRQALLNLQNQQRIQQDAQRQQEIMRLQQQLLQNLQNEQRIRQDAQRQQEITRLQQQLLLNLQNQLRILPNAQLQQDIMRLQQQIQQQNQLNQQLPKIPQIPPVPVLPRIPNSPMQPPRMH